MKSETFVVWDCVLVDWSFDRLSLGLFLLQCDFKKVRYVKKGRGGRGGNKGEKEEREEKS